MTRMSFVHIIMPIIIGSIIGYFTNYLAIKMLFRPHKPIYIGKFKLPFTPGIIPKNQKRIARAVGDAVSDQLLTKEAVLESLENTADKYISEIAAKVCGGISITEMLPKETENDKIINSLSDTLSKGIFEKAKQIDFDSVIGQLGREAIGSILGSSPLLAMLFNEDMQNRVCGKLGNAARNYLDAHGEEMIRQFVSEYIKEAADKPVGELVPIAEDKERLQDFLEKLFRKAAEKYGTDILNKIDVKGIVVKRVEEMDVDELEKLVLSVMNQELQAVINLGAVIGALIGIINIFL